MKRIVRNFLAITATGVFAAQAAPDWYSIGLNDRAVNCILADDTNAIIAGTDSGVSVRCNKTWYHIKMLPVKALARVSPMAVAAAAGNGSKSDGIYIGRKIINGPPFYSFTISNGNWITQPTALAMLPIYTGVHVAGPNGVLYAANGNSVVSGLVMNDSLKTLTPIGIPTWAFGMEMPYCSGLLMFSGRLYAGGYDRSPMPGSSVLLCSSAAGDSMFFIRQMKTTAVSSGRFLSILGTTFSVMVIADADSGVFFYDLSMGDPWRRINGPPGAPGSTNAFVLSLFVRQVSGSANDNMLYAANKDGVFQCTAGEPRPVWVKLGTQLAQPLYLTCVGTSGDLLAATISGVYRYGNQGTEVSQSSGTISRTKGQGKRITCLSGFSSPRITKGYTNPQGRSIGGKTSAGTKASGVVVPDIR